MIYTSIFKQKNLHISQLINSNLHPTSLLVYLIISTDSRFSLSLYLHNFFVLFGLEIVYYTFFWEQKKCGKVVKNMFSKALLGTHIQAILIVKYSAKEI